jgi:predicted deacylase
MLPPVEPPPPPRLRLWSDGNVDLALPASHAGVLLEAVGLLERVSRGQVLGTVVDDRGNTLETLCAPSDGIVVMARRTALVQPGDGAYLLALEAAPST